MHDIFIYNQNIYIMHILFTFSNFSLSSTTGRVANKSGVRVSRLSMALGKAGMGTSFTRFLAQKPYDRSHKEGGLHGGIP